MARSPHCQPIALFFFSSRRRHTRSLCDWSSDVCSSDLNEATVHVMAAEGCDVVAPADQGCCGALALHAGRLKEARAFARRTIGAFDRAGVDRIAVNAAGCGSSMKEYRQLLADEREWAERARG